MWRLEMSQLRAAGSPADTRLPSLSPARATPRDSHPARTSFPRGPWASVGGQERPPLWIPAQDKAFPVTLSWALGVGRVCRQWVCSLACRQHTACRGVEETSPLTILRKKGAAGGWREETWRPKPQGKGVLGEALAT